MPRVKNYKALKVTFDLAESQAPILAKYAKMQKKPYAVIMREAVELLIRKLHDEKALERKEWK